MSFDQPIKIMIVDDHDMVRRGLMAYLLTEDSIEVVAEASNGKEAVKLAEQYQPQVILMDLIMNEMGGIEATKAVKEVSPNSQVIILTSFVEDEQIIAAIEAGALSYLLKTARANEIVDAIHAATKGQPVLEPQVVTTMMRGMRKKPPALHDSLTNRELEVLIVLAEGKTNQEISETLHIGIKTVKTHISNILAKLEVEDRMQAALYAVKHGLNKQQN